MWRIVLPIIAVILIILAIIFRGVLLNRFTPTAETTQLQEPREVPLSTESANLTTTVNKLIDQSKKPIKIDSSTPPSSNANLEAKIKVLETSIADLRQQIRVLQAQTGSTTLTTTTTTSKAPIYIPIGSGGYTNAPTWTDASGVEISIDPADYPGYTSATFEDSLRISDPNQTASARLYNATDKSSLTSTEISTTSQSFVIVSSNTFNLTSGRKTYRLQLKSSGHEAYSQFARIKISY